MDGFFQSIVWNTWHVKLSKENHRLVLLFKSANENMIGEINQAMIDALHIFQIQ